MYKDAAEMKRQNLKVLGIDDNRIRHGNRAGLAAQLALLPCGLVVLACDVAQKKVNYVKAVPVPALTS